MKKFKMLAVFLMVVFMLTACDSSSGSSTNYKYSKTYSKTGTSYMDDSGEVFYENWTNKTTVSVSEDATHVRVTQEEAVGGRQAFVYDTIYTFSNPVSNVYFNGDTYTMTIKVASNTIVTAKMCEVRKADWQDNSATDVNLYVEDIGNETIGSFYRRYTLKSNKAYRIFPEHYEMECAGFVTKLVTY